MKNEAFLRISRPVQTCLYFFFWITIVSFTLIGCQKAQPVKRESPVTSNTAILKMTLSSLNLKAPNADVEENITSGDYRFVGICGFACYPPGLQDADIKVLLEKYGVRNLQGTTDSIESDEHWKLIRTATDYAIEYNRILLTKVKGG